MGLFDNMDPRGWPGMGGPGGQQGGGGGGGGLLLSRFQPTGYEAGVPGQASYGRGQLGRDYEQMLRDQAQGLGPSVAEEQMQMGLERQLAAASSMAAGATGMSPGMAQRLAGQQRGQAMLGTNQQMGMLRAQEQAQATGMLGDLLGQRRQEHLAMQGMGAQQQAQLNQLYMQQELARQANESSFQNRMMGGMFGAGGALLGGLM